MERASAIARLDQELAYSKTDKLIQWAKDAAIDTGYIVLEVGGGLAVLGAAIVGLTCVFPEERHPLFEQTWQDLNNQTAIMCEDQQDCEDLADMLDDNRKIIAAVAERAGIEPEELEALMAASYLNPHREKKRAEGYRGTILMLPEEAGVSGETLDNSLEQNIYLAALRYRAISESTNMIGERLHPEELVGAFFSSEPAVNSAVHQAEGGEARCNVETFAENARGREPDECAALISHSREIQEYNELTARIEDENIDEYNRGRLMGYRERLRVIRPGMMEAYRQAAHEMTWYHNLPDGYSREAVPLFFAYLNSGIAEQDERRDALRITPEE